MLWRASSVFDLYAVLANFLGQVPHWKVSSLSAEQWILRRYIAVFTGVRSVLYVTLLELGIVLRRGSKFYSCLQVCWLLWWQYLCTDSPRLTQRLSPGRRDATRVLRKLKLRWVPIRPRWMEVAVQIGLPVPEAAGTVFNTPDDGCCDTRNM